MRIMLRYLLPIFLFLSAFTHSSAQQMEVVNEDPYTPISLIENVFLGEGIDIISVNYAGDERSAAFFRNGGSTIGLDRGIVMTTGITVPGNTTIGVANSGDDNLSIDNDSQLSDDVDLRSIIGNSNTQIHDITSYEITFRPLGDSVSFRYVFASEEYPEYVCSRYNDLFGFFISGPGINGPFANGADNLALIPGTDLPVRINTVNPGIVGNNGSAANCTGTEGTLDNSDLYIDNNGSNNQPVFDGYTQIFTAATRVEACEVYTMKIIIADIGDARLDSGVFLDARSFGGDATNLEIVNLAIDGGLAEGCRPAALHFYTSQPVEQDLPLTVSFFGEATAGVDYTQPPTNLTIPAGDSLLIVPIEAFEDNLPDAGENIYISLLRSACFTDTFKIRIEENRMESLIMDDQFTVCGGEVVSLSSIVIGGESTVQTFTNSNPVNLSFSLFNPWRSSFIDVSGVVPEVLSELSFESVCINNLEHSRPAQIDVFLFSPTGVPLELTTDNGGNGGGAPFEGYLNTCFTLDATNRITGPGTQAPADLVPFTGNWQPEGSLDELWFGGSQPTNGRWELRVRDDALFTNGRLNEWSISFRKPYSIEYSWDQDADLSCYDCPDPQLTTTSEGFVGLTVSDIYGCSLRDSVEIIFEPTPAFSTAPGCVEGTDSSLTFNWGTAPGAVRYEVRTEDGDWFSVDTDTFWMANNLEAGESYNFYVRAIFSDCISPETALSCQTFNCEDSGLAVNGVASDALCADSLSGTISLSASGSFAPFSYTLNGEVRTDGVFESLGAGTYAGIATDARGCKDTTTLVVNEPVPVNATIIMFGAVGCNSNASLNAAVFGGNNSYDYFWNGISGSSSFDISSGGIYTLEVRDGNGCRAHDTINVVGPDVIAFTTSVTPAACSNVANGSITINSSGGTPPYRFEWSDINDDVGERLNLPAGTYQVTVKDATDCEVSETIVVSQGLDLSLQGTSEVASCFGEDDASIDISINNGVGTLNYSWGTAGVSGNNPQNLTAGTYNLTVTDERGCQVDTTMEVGQPDILAVSDFTLTLPSCIGENNGSVAVSVAGGTATYTYAWNNNYNGNNNTSLSAGNYVLTVTDANGCILEQAFDLPEPEAIVLDTEVTDNLCLEGEEGAILVSSPATSIVNYYWPSLNANGARQENLATGVYEVIATDSNNCATSMLVEVNAPPAIVADPLMDDVRCFGEQNGVIELSVSGGTPTYQFQLDERGWQNSNVFFDLAPGYYRGSIRDANNCIIDLDSLEVGEPTPLTIDLGDRQTIRYGDSLQLYVNVSGGVQPLIGYSWTPTDSTLFSCLDCPEPWISPTEQTTIYLRAMDQSGCMARGLLTVLVEKDFPVHVPTGFTPNGDGTNDRLIVHGLPDITIAHFQIFDRWGELLYEKFDFPTNDLMSGWDGTYKGELLNANVFIWQLEAVYPDGKRENYYGQSALIR